MKKLATIAGSLALLVATVLPAVAAGNNCGNSTTGPFATNYCTINNTSNVTVTNSNNATITNNVNATSNSGGNSTSYNTLGGTVHTGNATGNVTVSNVANVNTTTISGGPSGSSNSGMNGITGPYSDNRININNLHTVSVNNTNTAEITNNVNATADSGNNTADYNTGPAEVLTGNSRLGVSVANHANDSATGITAGAGGSAGNSGANDTTGPFSTDYITINNSANASVNNVNDLTLTNNVDVLSRSGVNSADYNTLGGSIGTGGSSAGVGINNEGNINTTTVHMAMGGFMNDGSNGVTGPFSDNRNELLNDLGISINNPNTSSVTNNNTDVVDTGNNTADYNTGGGGIASGWSDLVKSLLTHVNDTYNLIQ